MTLNRIHPPRQKEDLSNVPAHSDYDRVVLHAAAVVGTTRFKGVTLPPA